MSPFSQLEKKYIFIEFVISVLHLMKNKNTPIIFYFLVLCFLNISFYSIGKIFQFQGIWTFLISATQIPRISCCASHKKYKNFVHLEKRECIKKSAIFVYHIKFDIHYIKIYVTWKIEFDRYKFVNVEHTFRLSKN